MFSTATVLRGQEASNKEAESAFPLVSCEVQVAAPGSKKDANDKTTYAALLIFNSRLPESQSVVGRYTGNLELRRAGLLRKKGLPTGKGRFESDSVVYKGEFFKGFFHSSDPSSTASLEIGNLEKWRICFDKGRPEGDGSVDFTFRECLQISFSGRFHQGLLEYGHFQTGAGTVCARFKNGALELTDFDPNSHSTVQAAMTPRAAAMRLNADSLSSRSWTPKSSKSERHDLADLAFNQSQRNSQVLLKDNERNFEAVLNYEISQGNLDIDHFKQRLIRCFFRYVAGIEMMKFCLKYSASESKLFKARLLELTSEYRSVLEKKRDKAKSYFEKGLVNLERKASDYRMKWAERKTEAKKELEKNFQDFFHRKNQLCDEMDFTEVLAEEKKRLNTELENSLQVLQASQEAEEKLLQGAIVDYYGLEDRKALIFTQELQWVDEISRLCSLGGAVSKDS